MQSFSELVQNPHAWAATDRDLQTPSVTRGQPAPNGFRQKYGLVGSRFPAKLFSEFLNPTDMILNFRPPGELMSPRRFRVICLS